VGEARPLQWEIAYRARELPRDDRLPMTFEQIEPTLLVTAHVAVVAWVGARVILTRHPPGSSFAWLLLVAVLPVIGFVGYLLIGERPIGRLEQFGKVVEGLGELFGGQKR